MRLLRIGFLGLLVVNGTAAQGAEPKRTQKPEAPAELGKYELKRRSSCELPPSSRPPFWPIGWVKRQAGPAEVATAAAPTSQLEEKDFVLTSILLGVPSLAVINGRSYSEGEFLRLPKASPIKVQVRVHRILDGTVTLQAGAQLLLIKQRRQELGTVKAEKDVLNDDR